MPPPKQALNTEAISSVQAEIKRQIGVYIRASNNIVAIDHEQFWCGTGDIDFDISTVKAELTTTIEKINNAGLKLAIPVGAVTVGPSGGIKGDATNTQGLTYNLWLLSMSRQDPAIFKTAVTQKELGDAPIAEVLLSLREALIKSATKSAKGPQPCFTDYSPDKPAADAGNTFKLGLTFLTDVTGGLEIKVGIIDLTATTEWKGTTGNTLTVSFVQRGLAQLQRARDKADSECKYPKDDTAKACKDAVAEFQKLQEGKGIAIY